MSKQNCKNTIIITILISVILSGIVGGLAGFYSANYIKGETTPYLFSFLYQKFLKKDEPVIEKDPLLSQEKDNQAAEKKEIQKQIIGTEEKTIQAVEKTSPSVVSIVVSKYIPQYYGYKDLPSDEFFNEFFNSPFFEFKDFHVAMPYPGPSIPTPVPNPEPEEPKEDLPKQKVGGGTGFVVLRDKGLILTNKHVVSDKDADYTVVTNNGNEFKAKVLARDPFNDIAILKIENKDFDLPALDLGDSDKLKIGQTVIAIGNALGEYRNTVTKGVVSGIGRKVIAGGVLGQSETLEGVIQTDAAINSGNSGGPLIDLNARVVGINTAISRQGQLIGFSIPINQAKNVIESVEKHGRIVRPFLGVRYTLINEKIAETNNLEVDYGALIIKGSAQEELAVIPGSPADKAGLVENDIILKVNGNKVGQENSLSKLIQKHQPGDVIDLLVYHKGEEKELQATLEEYNK
ncbi:MAG TPA: trypsin-like peptidase domain-containing protein [Patescibacteria group bacterium]|nr:trypsin-like peptidase domain-containing protein [Patescibacteria group bacterium]